MNLFAVMEAITGTNQSEAENPSEDEDGDVWYVFALITGIEKCIMLQLEHLFM